MTAPDALYLVVLAIAVPACATAQEACPSPVEIHKALEGLSGRLATVDPKEISDTWPTHLVNTEESGQNVLHWRVGDDVPWKCAATFVFRSNSVGIESAIVSLTAAPPGAVDAASHIARGFGHVLSENMLASLAGSGVVVSRRPDSPGGRQSTLEVTIEGPDEFKLVTARYMDFVK